MSHRNASSSNLILLKANEAIESSSSILVETTEKSDLSVTWIVLIAGGIAISSIVLIALLGIFCYWDIFASEKTTPVGKEKVPVEKFPQKSNKRDNNKNRYLVLKKGSYEKTIYFTNFSEQTKNGSSLQNSQKSPKLNNPKFNQQKSQFISKLRQVSQSVPARSKTRTWKNRSRKTKIGKQTSESAAKNVSKKRSSGKIICKRKLLPISKR